MAKTLSLKSLTGQEDESLSAPSTWQPSMSQVPLGDSQPGDPVVAPAEGKSLSLKGLKSGTSVPAGTPDRNQYKFLDYDIDPALDPVVQPAMDAAIGFNSMIAKLGGVALTDVDSIMRDLGTDGFLDLPGDGHKVMQEKLSGLGIAADRKKAISDFMASIGEETFTGMMTLGAMFKAAPMMAAASGDSVSAILQRSIGQGLQQTPLGTTLASEGGSIVGGQLGQAATEGTPLEPLGAAVGAITGGAIGGSGRIADTLKGAGKGASVGAAAGGAAGTAVGLPAEGAGLGAAAGAVRGSVRGAVGGPQAERAALNAIPKGTAPLVNPAANIERVGEFAKSAVAGDKLRVENTVKNIVNSVKGQADPQRAAERLRGGLNRAYGIAQERASKLWQRVDMSRPMDTTGIQSLADDMTANASAFTADKELPGDILTRIRKMAGKPVTMKDFQAVRGVITTRLRDQTAALTDTERRNLNLLQGRLLKEMETQYPEDESLAAAREFSSWLHTQFDDGPVGQLLGRRAGGQAFDANLGDLDNPGAAVNSMINRGEKAGQQISGISQRLNDPELMRQGEQYIRERFTREAAELGPEGATKWMNKPEVRQFIKQFPQANAEMDEVGTALRTAFDERQAIENSAFTKFAGVEPQVAIQRLYGNPNKVQAAREITKGLSGDEDALEAFKSHILMEMWKSSNNSPSAVQTRLAAKDMQPMLREVFGDATLARINRNVSDAVKLENGGETASAFLGRKGSPIIARLIGLRVAGLVNPGGPGSLGTASIISNASKDIVQGLVQRIEPSALLSRAMIDPQFERILWSRQPENLKAANEMATTIRRIVSGVSAANQAIGALDKDEKK